MIHHLAVRLEKARVKDGFGGHGKMLLRDVVYGAVGMEAIVPFGPRNLGMGNEAYCWMPIPRSMRCLLGDEASRCGDNHG